MKNRKNKIPYNGNWADMEEEFKDEMSKLIEHLLSPDRLVMKKINGKELIGSEFYGFIDQYFQLFQSDQLPEAKSIYDTTIEKQLIIVVEKCFDKYKELLYSVRNELSYKGQIPIVHEECRKDALLLFEYEKKMGSYKHHQKFKEILEEKIETLYNDWRNITDKNIKMLEEEKEKTRKAIEEKEKLLQEQIKSEREARERLEKINAEQQERLKAELERSDRNLKEIRDQMAAEGKRYLETMMEKMKKQSEEQIKKMESDFAEERKIAEDRYEAEKERTKIMKAEKEARKGAAQRCLLLIGKKVGEGIDFVINEVEQAKEHLTKNTECCVM